MDQQKMTFYFSFFSQKMETEHKLIPWCVGSLEEFLFYCCPECDCKSSSEKLFLSHALGNHPHSIAYLLKFNVDQYENTEEIDVSHSLDVKEAVPKQIGEKVQIAKQELEGDPFSYNSTDCFDSMVEIKSEKLNEEDEDFDMEEDNLNTEYSEFENDENEIDPGDILEHEESVEDQPKPKKNNLQCDICGMVFAKPWGVKRHKLNIHTKKASEKTSNKGKFHCDICGMRFTKFGNVKRHKLRIHVKTILDDKGEPTTWMCYCGEKFQSNDSFTNHVSQIHEKPKEPPMDKKEKKVCEYCGKSISMGFYEEHINSQHLGKKSFKCSQCDKAYGAKDNLKNHIQIIHKNEKFQCHECGNSFASNQSLRNHVQVQHRGIPLERKYECDRCEKTFTGIVKLKNHVRTEHDKILAFSCDICGRKFSRKNGLINHIKGVHNDERSYPCRFCEKKFKGKSQVELHEKGVHLKIKDIKCYVCSQMFSRYHHLHNHLDKIHNIDISYIDLKKKLNSDKSKIKPDSPAVDTQNDESQ